MCIGRVYFCYRFAFALVATFAPPKFADVGQKVARRGSKWPTARGRVARKNEPSNWAFETEKKRKQWGEVRRDDMRWDKKCRHSICSQTAGKWQPHSDALHPPEMVVACCLLHVLQLHLLHLWQCLDAHTNTSPINEWASQRAHKQRQI